MAKMKFFEDKYVDGKLTFEKGKVVEVAQGSIDRWLIRGGQLVEEISTEDDAQQTTTPKKRGNK